MLRVAAGTQIRASILPQAHTSTLCQGLCNKHSLLSNTQSVVEGKVPGKQCQHEDPASGLGLSKHKKRKRKKIKVGAGVGEGWMNEVEQNDETQGNPNPKYFEELVLLDTKCCTITGQRSASLEMDPECA